MESLRARGTIARREVNDDTRSTRGYESNRSLEIVLDMMSSAYARFDALVAFQGQA
jgi:hypothetical protein